MKEKKYLFDTHAFVFWINQIEVSDEFIDFFDTQSQKGKVFISSASIWEIALLKKRGKIELGNIGKWEQKLSDNCPAKIINPTFVDMIDSTLVPDIHKDPFDRLLISQAINLGAFFVSRDKVISKYAVKLFWK